MLFASALAGLFLAASCQQENLEPVRSNTVTITVEAPGAINTKAIADGTNVNEVHYAVYKTNSGEDYAIDDSGAIDGPLAQGVVEMSNKRASIDFDLLQDQDFTVIFWAQVAGAGHYTLGDLRTITIDNAVVDGNDETRAAFFARYDFSTYEHQDHKVTLRRPFAQLNLLTTLESLTPVQQGQTIGYTLDVQTSEVKVIGLGTAFNTLTGVAPAADETLLYEMAATPAKQGQATLTVGAKDYHYVSMNYLFVPEEEKLVDIEYSIVTDKGSIEHEIVAVPVKENYRTNIIGNLFTKETKFEIIVDAEFETPEHVIGDDWTQTGEYKYVVNEGASAATLADILAHADAQAKAAATKAAGPEVIITLNGDVEWETGAGIGSTPLLPEDSPISAVVINGNGKTFTATGKGVGKIRLANGGKLTFDNVKIVDHSVSYAENAWEYGYLEFGGVIRLQDCEVVNAIMVSGETAAFKNCSFNSNKDNEYDVWVDNGSAYFTDCTFAGARGLKVHEAYGSEVVKVAVDGCTFGPLSKKPGIALGDLNAETTVSVKNSTFDRCQAGDQGLFIYETDTDVTTFTFVCENNFVIPVGDEPYVQEDGTIVVATAEALKKAIAAAEQGATIVLADGTFEGLFYVNGKSLNFEALNAGEATINGKLAIAAGGKTINVKGIVFENSYAGSVAAGHQYLDKTGKYCIGLYCASVNVENCTFNLSDNGGINFYAINAPERCTVKNSTFNCNGFRPMISKADLTVDGCTFNDQYKYSVQVWGNANTGAESVVFTNNTINEAGKTSGCADVYKSYVSVSKSYPLSKVAFTITGNTAGYNFVYDNHANVDITSCTLNGAAIVAEQCYSVANDIKEVAMDYKAGYTYVGSAAEFTAALADSKVAKIALVGTIDGTFTIKRDVEVTSAGATATLKGRVNIANCNPTFVNVNFDRSTASDAAWNTANGTSNCLQYKAVVMIYGNQLNKVTFEKCNFYNNGGTHKSAITNTAVELVIDECYFEGRSSAIYTQANISMTNSTINYTGTNNVVLSINGVGEAGGKVIFKNNKVTGDNIFVLGQFLSTTGFGNGKYYFDVQGNDEKFDNIFFNTSRVTNKEFAAGSLTF